MRITLRNSFILIFTAIILIISGCNPLSPEENKTLEELALPATEIPLPTDTPGSINSEDPPTPTLTATAVPVIFSESVCAFELPVDLTEGDDIICGTILVPENRSKPDGLKIELAVAILKNPQSASIDDPILYLEGGPGGSVLEFLYLTYDSNFLPMFESGRDIILFDQRGVGVSQPALDCPEEDAISIELLDNEKDGRELTYPEMDQLVLDAYAQCVKDLKTTLDLSQYNSDANAADVADLIQALNLEQVNLWGVSYGTRLALEVMRDHPEKIRSVLLDSTYPPQANLFLEQPANFDRAFDTFFSGCEKDPACNAAYPNLRNTFFETTDLWNETPANFVIRNLLTGTEYDTVIDGNNLMDLIFQFLYDTDLIPDLPQIITDAHNGAYDYLAFLISALITTDSAFSDGMYWSVQCADELAYTDKNDFIVAGQEFPEYAQLFEEDAINFTYDLCSLFDVSPSDPSANEAVSSDIPTLVFAGEYDPVTPPDWGLIASQTITNSTFLEFPGFGHGSSFQEGCPQEIAIDFFQDPEQTLDTSCVQNLNGPTFTIPTDAGSVTFVDYEGSLYGLQGKVPENWDEVNPGVLVLNEGKPDQSILLLLRSENDSKTMMAGLLKSLGHAEDAEVADTIQANGLSWDIYNYTIRGSSVRIAIADSGGYGLLVMLQTLGSDQEDLYQHIFIPVIESLVPLE